MREHFLHICPGVTARCLLTAALMNLPGLQAGDASVSALAGSNDTDIDFAQAIEEVTDEQHASRSDKGNDGSAPPLVYVFNRDRAGLPRPTLFEQPDGDLFTQPLCWVNQSTAPCWVQNVVEQLRSRELDTSSIEEWRTAKMMAIGITILDVTDAERVKSAKPRVKETAPGHVELSREYDDRPRVLNLVDEGLRVRFGWYPGFDREDADDVDYDQLMAEDAQSTHDHIFDTESHGMSPAMLVAMGPSSPTDEAASRSRFQEESAAEKLRAAQEQLARLIKQHPDSQAAADAATMLDGVHLKAGVGQDPGPVPKDAFMFGGVYILQ